MTAWAPAIWPLAVVAACLIASLGVRALLLHRGHGPATLDVQRSILVNRSPEDVWDYCYDPAAGVGVHDTLVSGRHVTGTPIGRPGEWQATVFQIDGRRVEVVSEVLALERGRLLVTQQIGAAPLSKLIPRTDLVFEPTAEGACELTATLTLTVRESAVFDMDPKLIEFLVASPEDYLQRVKKGCL